MSRIGLGFAGVGWLGESLIKELPLFPELELVAVQDARSERAQQVGNRYGSQWSGDRFDDLLERPGLDAVVICTPNAFHVPQATQALRAGKHVLVQKPLALSSITASVAQLSHSSFTTAMNSSPRAYRSAWLSWPAPP